MRKAAITIDLMAKVFKFIIRVSATGGGLRPPPARLAYGLRQAT